MQTRTGSITETVISTLLGYLVAVGTQVLVFPWFGIQVTLGGNLAIAGIFTAVSIVRGYLIRRLFNAITAWDFRPHVR